MVIKINNFLCAAKAIIEIFLPVFRVTTFCYNARGYRMGNLYPYRGTLSIAVYFAKSTNYSRDMRIAHYPFINPGINLTPLIISLNTPHFIIISIILLFLFMIFSEFFYRLIKILYIPLDQKNLKIITLFGNCF